jgi:ribonucleoside-triphosphate reductase
MNSDKNTYDLDKILKVIQQHIRRKILKKLYLHKAPILYSTLQKKVLGPNLNTVNFAFHLKQLKKLHLISSDEQGYSITDLGKKILMFISNMENTLEGKNKAIMIRTSKYSKEHFNKNKIQDYLIKEGGLDLTKAKELSHKVLERLNNTEIEYLTAPMMREIINVILLENNLEEVRHKLTRLGTPPYEVNKLFNSEKNQSIAPDKFIRTLGSDVSEQFLLLNQLLNELADQYLSGDIILLYLNYWALRPLSIYLDSENILQILLNSSQKNLDKAKYLTNLILNLMELLMDLKPYVSEDILIGNFNRTFFSKLEGLEDEDKKFLINILIKRILKNNNRFNDFTPQISLDFNYDMGDLTDMVKSTQLEIDAFFLNDYINIRNTNNFKNPKIMIDYSRITPQDVDLNLLNNNIIFYNGRISDKLNSANISINNRNEKEHPINRIILDKIFINLHSIAVKSNQNDDKFFDILQSKLDYIFELFQF